MYENELFVKYENGSGEAYYCPFNSNADSANSPEWDQSDCVEISTVARYSGNLEVVDRFSP